MEKKKVSVAAIVCVGINAVLFVCGFMNVMSMFLAMIMFPLTEHVVKGKEA